MPTGRSSWPGTPRIRRGSSGATDGCAHPYGRLDNVVRSYEWTRLEPNVVSLKLYAPHLGIVEERDVAGGEESLKLVAVKHR